MLQGCLPIRQFFRVSIFVVFSCLVFSSSLYANTPARDNFEEGLLKRIHPIFKNQSSSYSSSNKPSFSSVKKYLKRLKGLRQLNITEDISFRVKSIKAAPLSSEKRQIVNVNPDFNPRISSEGLNSKGYGIEFKMKLD